MLVLCGISSLTVSPGRSKECGQLLQAQAGSHAAGFSSQHSVNLGSKTICKEPLAIKLVNSFRSVYQNIRAVS